MKLRATAVLVAAAAAMTSLGASTAVAAGEREVHLKREDVMRTDGMVTKREFRQRSGMLPADDIARILDPVNIP